MNLWDEYIAPPLVSFACSMKPIRYQRAKVVPKASGTVLEVGFGSGLNLPYYNADKVDRLFALEPHMAMRKRAAKRVDASPLDIEYLDLPGEEIPLEDHAVDTVLVTYTMCTIPDVAKALAGMKRVIKPGGQMIFCEHGLAPDEDVAKWQRRIEPAWKVIAGGCHLTRAIPDLINEAGFEITETETMYLPSSPRPLAFNYWGTARPA